MRLWVDDMRTCPPVPEDRQRAHKTTQAYDYNDEAWVRAYDYNDAIACLSQHKVSWLSLDHDLGEGMSGYDVACWLEREIFLGHVQMPEQMTCHSDNPVGRKRILQVFDAIRRHSTSR